MGLCMSRGETETTPTRAAPPSKDTALVLMPSGEMREYPPHTATAARVLQDAASASATSDWFLCDADGVGLEGPVPAARADDALRAGQIYFVLPAAARRRGLRREEVAALAVRASAALSARARHSCARGKRSKRCGAVAPLVFAPPPEEQEEEHGQRETFVAASCKAPPVRRPSRSGRRLQRFASDLTAIPECEMATE